MQSETTGGPTVPGTPNVHLEHDITTTDGTLAILVVGMDNGVPVVIASDPKTQFDISTAQAYYGVTEVAQGFLSAVCELVAGAVVTHDPDKGSYTVNSVELGPFPDWSTLYAFARPNPITVTLSRRTA